MAGSARRAGRGGAVHAVGQHDESASGRALAALCIYALRLRRLRLRRLRLRRLRLRLSLDRAVVLDPDAELAGALLEQVEQPAARDAVPVAAEVGRPGVPEMDQLVLPHGRDVAQPPPQHRVDAVQLAQQLTREDDPPAVGDPTRVALQHGDVPAGVAQLREGREHQAGRSAADTDDLHAASRSAGAPRVRRPTPGHCASVRGCRVCPRAIPSATWVTARTRPTCRADGLPRSVLLRLSRLQSPFPRSRTPADQVQRASGVCGPRRPSDPAMVTFRRR